MSYNFLKQARTIRNSFLCRYDGLDSYVSDFHINGNVDSWDIYNNIYLYGCWEGILFGTSYDSSCYVSRTDNFLPVPAENYYYVRIMMKITTNGINTPTIGRIEWVTLSDPAWDTLKQFDFDIIADDKWHLYDLNVGPESYWQGNVSNLRIYPFIDGHTETKFAIKYIKISSLNSYTCSNRSCDYYIDYMHNCPGAGGRGSFEAGVSSTLYTTVSGISDELVVDIDGYGAESFRLGSHTNLGGVEMARVVAEKISRFNLGGYTFADCEYDDYDKLKIISGTVGVGSSVTISGTAAEVLGFYSGDVNVSTTISGVASASGFDYASARLLTAYEINKLIDGVTDSPAYTHNPTQYNVEGGRRDFNDIGTAILLSSMEAGDYYESLNNYGKTIIDFSHPIDNNGRIKAIYLYGIIDSLAKVKILRPYKNKTLEVIYSLDLPQKNASYLYTSNSNNYRLDCDILVNKGDLIGIYNANLYVGQSPTGLPDATFCQVAGDIFGTVIPGDPMSFGVGGLAIYARGDRYQTNTIIDIDFGDRINISEMNIYGSEKSGYFEFNIAACKDVTWTVDLFSETHGHPGLNNWTGESFYHTHTNIAYGISCLNDCIRTADNGQMGTSYGTSGGNGLWTAGPQAYFYVNGDAEWLYQGTCNGKTEYCWPNVPDGCIGFQADPLSFTVVFPHDFRAAIHKTALYFKERNNFRNLALSYYLGPYNRTGNADIDSYRYVPNYSAIWLDGTEYIPTSDDISNTYIFNNPMDDRVIYASGDSDPINWEVYRAAQYTTWASIIHEFDPVECYGFRFYTNLHRSTKLNEIEIYSRVAVDPSLVDNVSLSFSDYGDTWVSVGFTEITESHVNGFLGGAPRYLKLNLESSTEFTLNEIECSVTDQLRLNKCETMVYLDDARRNTTNAAKSLVITNEYDKAFDLSIDIPKSTPTTDDLVFYSRLNSQEDLDDPQIGPSCGLFKSEDFEILNANFQCAINCPSYGLKNLVDGKDAYYSYNDADYFYFGTLTSGVSVSLSNIYYVGYRKTVFTFPASSSKYWKVFFPSITGLAFVNDILGYYNGDRKSIESVFLISADGIYSQSGEAVSDGILMFEQDNVYTDNFEDGTYSGSWLVYNWNSSGTVTLQESAGRLFITSYGTRVSGGSLIPYGAYAEHTLECPLGDFDLTTDFLMYESSSGGYFGISLINSASVESFVFDINDPYPYARGDVNFRDRVGTKYSINGGFNYTTINIVRIVRNGITVQFYLNGVLKYSGTSIKDIIYKIRYYFGRLNETGTSPCVEIGVYNLQVSYDGRPFIEGGKGIGFSLNNSDPLNSITLIHENIIINSAEIYTSPDNGDNYVKIANTSQVIISPKNEDISTNFVIDLEKRHDLDIIRNYGPMSNKLYLSTSSYVIYSNTETDDPNLVVWSTGSKDDARWIKINVFCGDATVRNIDKLGIYPDISSIYCQGGGYNCEWESLGTVLTDYAPSIDVAYGCTVTGTNYYFLDYYPSNAVDGVFDDYRAQACWGFQTVSGVKAYLELDFGAAYQIDRVKLYHGCDPKDSSYLNTAYTFSVSASTSGSFTDVFVVTGNTEFERTHQFAPTYARRARLTMDAFNTERQLIYDDVAEVFYEFLGSYLRNIEVYNYIDEGSVDSETWPVVCVNLGDQFNITGHELINKDILDITTNWDNNDVYFMYSDSLLDDPTRVSFYNFASYVMQYSSNASSGNMAGAREYVFSPAIYFDKGRYTVVYDTYDMGSTDEISLRLEGTDVVDFYGDAASGWATQSGIMDITESGFYVVKGVQHIDMSDSWGVRYPRIYRSSGLMRWVSVKRDTATDYSFNNVSTNNGIDYLSQIKVYGDIAYRPTEYSGWWQSTNSVLSNNAMLTKVGAKSLEISYPAFSGIDTVDYRGGDDFGQDTSFDVMDILYFWWYISDVTKLDTSFGAVSFGIIDNAAVAYYTWDIDELDLVTGWNEMKLQFKEANHFYPMISAEYAMASYIDSALDFRNNGRGFTSFKFQYRGKGQSFTMNLDDLRIMRNAFESTVKFDKGLCLTGHDYLDIPLSEISLEHGTIEFWMKPYTDSYGINSFNDMASRVLFTVVNNNNDIISLGIKSGNWLEPVAGHIRKALSMFDIDNNDLPSSSFFDIDQVIHIAFVWSNDGSCTDNGETIRLYINGELLCAGRNTWEVGDTKSATLKLGGGTTYLAHNHDAYGSAVFENLKIYNFCKSTFDLVNNNIEKSIVYDPNDFMEISQDGIAFYGTDSANLPIVFTAVPSGDSRTVYIRANKDQRFLQSKLTGTLVVSWTTSV